MSIRVKCPKCGAGLKAPNEFAGRTLKCPKCGGRMQLPQLETPHSALPSGPPSSATHLPPQAGPTAARTNDASNSTTDKMEDERLPDMYVRLGHIVGVDQEIHRGRRTTTITERTQYRVQNLLLRPPPRWGAATVQVKCNVCERTIKMVIRSGRQVLINHLAMLGIAFAICGPAFFLLVTIPFLGSGGAVLGCLFLTAVGYLLEICLSASLWKKGIGSTVAIARGQTGHRVLLASRPSEHVREWVRRWKTAGQGTCFFCHKRPALEGCSVGVKATRLVAARSLDDRLLESMQPGSLPPLPPGTVKTPSGAYRVQRRDVPRCRRCRRLHKAVSGIAASIAVVLTTPPLILALAAIYRETKVSKGDAAPALLLAFMFTMIVSYGCFWLIWKVLEALLGSKSYWERYPPVRELTIQGWDVENV